jgi:hypothetical protein
VSSCTYQHDAQPPWLTHVSSCTYQHDAQPPWLTHVSSCTYQHDPQPPWRTTEVSRVERAYSFCLVQRPLNLSFHLPSLSPTVPCSIPSFLLSLITVLPFPLVFQVFTGVLVKIADVTTLPLLCSLYFSGQQVEENEMDWESRTNDREDK